MVIINSEQEALQCVDTAVRAKWATLMKHEHGVDLGPAKIRSEVLAGGHKAWSYEIEGLPLSMDARTRWLIDTGETVDTTMTPGEETIEAAYKKIFGKPLD